MGRVFKRQGNAPYARIIFTVLALVTLYFVEISFTHRSSVDAASALEPVFSPPGGYHDRDIQLRISPPDLGDGQTEVIFTLDGRVPTHTVGAA